MVTPAPAAALQKPAEQSEDDTFVDSLFAESERLDEAGPLSTVDYLCELHETWLHCMETDDIDSALSTLTEAAASMAALDKSPVAALLVAAHGRWWALYLRLRLLERLTTSA